MFPHAPARLPAGFSQSDTRWLTQSAGRSAVPRCSPLIQSDPAMQAALVSPPNQGRNQPRTFVQIFETPPLIGIFCLVAARVVRQIAHVPKATQRKDNSPVFADGDEKLCG